MFKRILPLIFIIMLLFCGCTQNTKGDYIAPTELTEEEKNLLKIVSPQDFILFDYVLNEHNCIILIVEKYENGELIETVTEPGMSSSEPLGESKICIFFDEDKKKGHVAIDGRLRVDFDIKVDYHPLSVAIPREKKEIKDGEEIFIFFRQYSDKTRLESKDFDINYIAESDLKEFKCCYIIKAVVTDTREKEEVNG